MGWGTQPLRVQPSRLRPLRLCAVALNFVLIRVDWCIFAGGFSRITPPVSVSHVAPLGLNDICVYRVL